MDDVARPPLPNGHLQRVQHELSAQVVGHGPANDLAAPGVENNGQVEKSGRGRDVGDVGHPELVPSLGCEVAIHQIRCRAHILIASRRDGTALTMTGTDQASFTHQAGNPLASMPSPVCPKLGMNTGRAIELPRTGVDGHDPLEQSSVGLCMRRRWAVAPSVIAWRGDAEHARHWGTREQGLVRAHEPEDPDGIVPVSRARLVKVPPASASGIPGEGNQAGAFETMSRSTLSWRTSRRSRISSSRSAPDAPSPFFSIALGRTPDSSRGLTPPDDAASNPPL